MNFTGDCSISDRRAHHKACRDPIYPPGGTLTSTSDQRATTLRSSLQQTPPRASTCGRVDHFPATSFHLQTRRPPTRSPMPLILPFDTCSCEFYSLLSSIALGFCSFCAISGHLSLCCDSRHLHRLCGHS